MGGGGGGGGAEHDPVTIIRYTEYVEVKHKSFLSAIAAYKNKTIDDSPFADFTDIEIDSAFFGVDSYGFGRKITSSAALYDVFGKHMAALDIEALWDTSFSSTLTNNAIDELSAAEAALLDDEIDSAAEPDFIVAMRDINAITSSTFIVGCANIEVNRAKSISAFNNNLIYTMLPDAQKRWDKTIDWNKAIVELNSRMHQTYYDKKVAINDFNSKMSVEDTLWPFTVLEWERAALGALQGARSAASSMETKDDRTGIQKGLGGALSGATVGYQVGGGWGAAIGGALGAIGSLADWW